MKRLINFLAFIITINAFSQVPQGFNYQATVRSVSGDLIVNQNVYFKFNILQGSQTATPTYSETHYVPTDDAGQISLVIGEGTASIGVFSDLDWSSGSHFLGIELNTGNGYMAMGTTQFYSVPYALYAKNTSLKKTVYSGVIDTSLEGDVVINYEIGAGTQLDLHYKEILTPEINTNNLPIIKVYLKPSPDFYSDVFLASSNDIWIHNEYVPSFSSPNKIADYFIDNGKLYIMYKFINQGNTNSRISGEYQIIILN